MQAGPAWLFSLGPLLVLCCSNHTGTSTVTLDAVPAADRVRHAVPTACRRECASCHTYYELYGYTPDAGDEGLTCDGACSSGTRINGETTNVGGITYNELYGYACPPVAATCGNGTQTPAGYALSPTDCPSPVAGYWYNWVPASDAGDEGLSCDGACSSATLSNGELTNVGGAGNMHGPQGDNVRSVSKACTIPSGVAPCSVAWGGYAFDSRDSGTDYLCSDGVDVRSRTFQWNQSGDDSSGVQTDLSQYCWSSCRFYTYSDSGSWSGSCSGTMTLQFTSNINQGESDEGWGFNNVVVTYGSGASTPTNCAAVATSTGTYTIYPDGSTPVSVWCDMDTDGGGYDSVLVTGGTRTCGSTNSNSCPSGMDIFVPRTQAHYAAIISKYGTGYIDSGAVGKSYSTCQGMPGFARHGLVVLCLALAWL